MSDVRKQEGFSLITEQYEEVSNATKLGETCVTKEEDEDSTIG